MDRTVKTELINIDLLKQKPELLENSIKTQQVELFKQLNIKDNQPIILTFKSTRENDLLASFGDPLGYTELKTHMHVEIPQIRHIVINKAVYEDYKEYKGFWAKLKLLFSKKSIYTKETRED